MVSKVQKDNIQTEILIQQDKFYVEMSNLLKSIKIDKLVKDIKKLK